MPTNCGIIRYCEQVLKVMLERVHHRVKRRITGLRDLPAGNLVTDADCLTVAVERLTDCCLVELANYIKLFKHSIRPEDRSKRSLSDSAIKCNQLGAGALPVWSTGHT